MRYFKATYDFTASEPVELSVKKGELMCCSEYVEHDGWIKVEAASDTRRKGFVPMSYMKEQQAPEQQSQHDISSRSNNLSSLVVASGEDVSSHSAAAVALTSGISRERHSPSRQYGSSDCQLTIAGNATDVPNPSVVEAFMKNEVYFKQLMKQRQEALTKMESLLSEAENDVSSCKDKNAVLARKLRDLDQNIDKERRMWKERLEEEKLLIQRSASTASAYFPEVMVSRKVTVSHT
eukprot:Tbor_TRINITY_DN2815_c0_g1::TRINITY_DN2815_c0_g1_i1::g.23161::m.23161